ncbi:phosphoglycolate phosphatase [Enterobacteriaceae bacterium LUAb1]
MVLFTDLRALAFDLDGTLINSATGLAEAIDRMLTELSLPAAGVERVSRWIGDGVDVMLERALRWAMQPYSPEARIISEARMRFDFHYTETVNTGSTLFPDVKDTLAALVHMGYPLAIITNKPTPFVAPLLEHLKIIEMFSLIIGGDDVVVKKPHPAPLFMALGTFGLLPRQLLFIGDSYNDILAAQAAGCPCIGMTFGYNYGEPIADSHPDITLDHFNQLLPLIENAIRTEK